MFLVPFLREVQDAKMLAALLRTLRPEVLSPMLVSPGSVQTFEARTGRGV